MPTRYIGYNINKVSCIANNNGKKCRTLKLPSNLIYIIKVTIRVILCNARHNIYYLNKIKEWITNRVT